MTIPIFELYKSRIKTYAVKAMRRQKEKTDEAESSKSSESEGEDVGITDQAIKWYIDMLIDRHNFTAMSNNILYDSIKQYFNLSDDQFNTRKVDIKRMGVERMRELAKESESKVSILTFNVQFYQTESVKVISRKLANFDVDVICIQEDVGRGEPSLQIPGFKRVTSCDGQRNTVQNGDIMGNPVYVRNELKYVVDKSITLTGCKTPRCVSYVTVKGVKIANTHLCGGRFDDEHFKQLKNTKVNEMSEIVRQKPDIVVGDFNGEPGDVVESLNGYNLFSSLTPNEKKVFMVYFNSVHAVLQKSGYTPAYSVEEIGPTSTYGGTPDWIYHNTSVDVKYAEQVTALNDLSDHNDVFVQFVKS